MMVQTVYIKNYLLKNYLLTYQKLLCIQKLHGKLLLITKNNLNDGGYLRDATYTIQCDLDRYRFQSSESDQCITVTNYFKNIYLSKSNEL